MLRAGLVSVSFRPLSPREVIDCAARAGLKHIEWGSDVHAPCSDRERLWKIAEMQREYGVNCCSYGTYFRLGVTSAGELERYIDAAEIIGTDILRVWCGDKGSEEYTSAEREHLLGDCIRAAETAQRHGVTLCLECHNNTYTDRKESALELMHSINAPSLRMYWQPNQFRTTEENIAYARALTEYTEHLHVFNWHGEGKYPLHEGIGEWLKYLEEFSGDRMLLLEFMPDDRPESLSSEADALRELIACAESRNGGTR